MPRETELRFVLPPGGNELSEGAQASRIVCRDVTNYGVSMDGQRYAAFLGFDSDGTHVGMVITSWQADELADRLRELAAACRRRKG